MKILTLNIKQQHKLFELIKEFFPELYSFDIKDCDNYFGDRVYDIVSMFKTEEAIFDKDRITIHWYQLCLTELPKRIWNKLQNSELGFLEEFDDREYTLNHFVTNVHKYPQDISISYKEDFQGLKNYCTAYHPVEFLYDFVTFCKKNKYFK